MPNLAKKKNNILNFTLKWETQSLSMDWSQLNKLNSKPRNHYIIF
jgi:hypothetical protein